MEMKCRNCGSVCFSEDAGVLTCRYCGAKFTPSNAGVGKTNEKIANKKASVVENKEKVATQVSVKPKKHLGVVLAIVCSLLVVFAVFIGITLGKGFFHSITANAGFRIEQIENGVNDALDKYVEIETGDTKVDDWQSYNSFGEQYAVSNAPLKLKNQCIVLLNNQRGNTQVRQFSCVVHNSTNQNLYDVEFNLYYEGDNTGFTSTIVDVLPANSDSTVLLFPRGIDNIEKVKLSYTLNGNTYYLTPQVA